ncbi:hypothetical protein evm_010680 [Chilo suppressalis]|nr:hypothetical protein evm_010680 [Chilo suppressalis]
MKAHLAATANRQGAYQDALGRRKISPTMFKLFVAILAVLGLAAAKPSFYSSPVVYSSYSPVAYSAYSSPIAYSAYSYSSPVAYSAYSVPVAYSSYPAYYWKK